MRSLNSVSIRHALRTYWLWTTIVLTGLAITLVVPGGFARTARKVLHGLCAQTPDHSFLIGGNLLPFDARMTGIYLGALAGLGILAAKRRFLSQELPRWSVLMVLGAFMLSMALDGTNSLFTDLGIWHPWTTTNLTRLVTGYLAGITMAAAIAWLIAGTLWHLARNEPPVHSVGEVLVMTIPLPVTWLLIAYAPSALYVPIAMLLMFGAWVVLALLATAAILLATHWDNRILRLDQLHVPGAIGLLVGLAIALALAFGRSWLERTLGVPSTL